jgi:3-oxoacyl-[acyl-carrier protein] reductase
MASGHVLVTGGSGGLGRAVVEVLRRDGVRVEFTYNVNADGARALAEATGARAWRLELRDLEGFANLLAAIEGDGGTIDGLVNGAGVRGEVLLAMTSDADWERLLDINLGGVFRACRAIIPGMVTNRRGAIVNIVSLGALHGVAGQAAYAAAKAGIVGMTRALAREVGRRGVRVNAVAPGYVPTGMTGGLPDAVVETLRRGECLSQGVTPRSVAETVTFLLSDRAESITGQCLVVDAGITA